MGKLVSDELKNKLIDNYKVRLINGGDLPLLPEEELPFFLCIAGTSRNKDKSDNKLNDPSKVVRNPRQKSFLRENYRRHAFEFVLDGSGYLEIDNMSYEIHAGDVYILPQGHTHYYYPGEDGWIKRYFVCLGPLPAHLLAAYSLSGCYHFRKCDHLRRFFDEMVRIYGSHSAAKQTRAAQLLLELVIALAEGRQAHPQNKSLLSVQKIRTVIDCDLHKKLNLEKLAEQFNISSWQLTKLFKKWTGTTPYEYYLARKVELSRDLLVNEGLTVSEIAEKLAFANSYHFSKIFHAKTGMSPTEFRELYGNGRKI